jgi:hypothetical protein
MLTAAPCLVQQQQWPAAQQDLQHLWQETNEASRTRCNTHSSKSSPAAAPASQQLQQRRNPGSPAAPAAGPAFARLSCPSSRCVLAPTPPGTAAPPARRGAAQAGMSGGAGLVSADGCSAGRDWQGSGSGYVSSSPGDLRRPTVAVMDRALVCSRLGLIQGGIYGIVEWRTESCLMLNY